MSETGIRKPAVAGSFYAGNQKSLSKQLEKCFCHKLGPGKMPQTNLEKKDRKIIGLVSPHAGYIYSGPIAAHGYYEVALDGKPDTVIIIGPNHRGSGASVSIMLKGKWETPLGELEVDENIAQKILDNSKIIRDDFKAHQYEHSIEVQLPFLQYIFGNAIKIVPLCMSLQDIKTDIEVAQSICKAINKENVLIIASSDFTHYETQEYAQSIDRKALDAIINFEPGELYDFIYKMNMTICGPGPITTMLIACKTLGADKAKLLKYATSGDTSGFYNQVVGYASLIFCK